MAPRKFGRGWEVTPEVREGSGGPPESPEGVGRAPRKLVRGRGGPRKSGRGWEGSPEVLEWL